MWATQRRARCPCTRRRFPRPPAAAGLGECRLRSWRKENPPGGSNEASLVEGGHGEETVFGEASGACRGGRPELGRVREDEQSQGGCAEEAPAAPSSRPPIGSVPPEPANQRARWCRGGPEGLPADGGEREGGRDIPPGGHGRGSDGLTLGLYIAVTFTASQCLSLSFPSTPSPYAPAHLSRLTHPPTAGGGVRGCGGGPAPARCA